MRKIIKKDRKANLNKLKDIPCSWKEYSASLKIYYPEVRI